VALNRKQHHPDSLPPLLVDVKENHPDLDGIFNSPAYRDSLREVLGNDAELFASIAPRIILETKQTSKIPLLGLPKSPNTVGYNISLAMRWSFGRKVTIWRLIFSAL